MFELGGADAGMAPACQRGLIGPPTSQFCAPLISSTDHSLAALCDAMGSSVHAIHSAFAFTSLLDQAANLCPIGSLVHIWSIGSQGLADNAPL